MSNVLQNVYGLSGGIASGKSTVSDMFSKLGAGVLDADKLARELSAPGTPGQSAILKHFGNAFMLSNGELDREKLGAHIFQEPQAREALNAILHPLIIERSKQEIVKLLDTHPYVIYDAALLVETGRHQDLRALIIVKATPEQQIERLMKRNHIKEEQALARVRSQLPLEDKVALADYVIDNSGSLEQTETQVRRLHETLMSEN